MIEGRRREREGEGRRREKKGEGRGIFGREFKVCVRRESAGGADMETWILAFILNNGSAELPLYPIGQRKIEGKIDKER